jgi:hypothetical protein
MHSTEKRIEFHKLAAEGMYYEEIAHANRRGLGFESPPKPCYIIIFFRTLFFLPKI